MTLTLCCGILVLVGFGAFAHDSQAAEWKWRTGPDGGFVRKHSGCSWTSVEFGQNGPVVGGAFWEKGRIVTWKKPRRDGRWVPLRKTATGHRSETDCMKVLFPGAAYTYELGPDGMRIAFDGNLVHAWQGKRVIADSAQPPLLARSRHGRAGVIAWFEKTGSGSVLHAALVGHGIEGAGEDGIVVVEHEIEPGKSPKRYSGSRTPLVVSHRGDFGITWLGEDGALYSLWRDPQGEWSEIEQVVQLDGPNPGVGLSVGMSFDSGIGTTGPLPAAVSWVSYSDPLFNLHLRLRDGEGQWSPTRTAGLFSDDSGSVFGDSALAVDLNDNRVATAWQYEDSDYRARRFLVSGDAGSGALTKRNLRRVPNHSLNNNAFLYPYLLTKGRTLVVAGDMSFVAGRLFSGGSAVGGWKFAFNRPDEIEVGYLGFNTPSMLTVKKNRRVGLVLWNSGKGVTYREFR